MHPQYQEHIRELSCVLCTCVLENWNWWTSTVDDDVEREHKDTRSLKNAYWETALVILKTLISLFRCVWLGLELNSAGQRHSRRRCLYPGLTNGICLGRGNLFADQWQIGGVFGKTCLKNSNRFDWKQCMLVRFFFSQCMPLKYHNGIWEQPADSSCTASIASLMTIQFVSQLAVFTDETRWMCVFVNFGKQKVSDFGSVLRDSFQLKAL